MAPTVQKPPSAVFVKTKMCKFHLQRRCAKGLSCPFAHDMNELKAVPDLTCTRVCPTLLKDGVCLKPMCNYAHSKYELRDSVSDADATGMDAARGAGLRTQEQPRVQEIHPLDALVQQLTASYSFQQGRAGEENVHPRYFDADSFAPPPQAASRQQFAAPQLSDPMKVPLPSLSTMGGLNSCAPAYINVPPGLEEWNVGHSTGFFDSEMDMLFKKPHQMLDALESTSTRSSSAGSSRKVSGYSSAGSFEIPAELMGA